MKVGTRVRLRSASHVVELDGDTGYVIRHDTWTALYYIIRLDRPARYHAVDGSVTLLSEIREDAENLEVLVRG